MLEGDDRLDDLLRPGPLLQAHRVCAAVGAGDERILARGLHVAAPAKSQTQSVSGAERGLFEETPLEPKAKRHHSPARIAVDVDGGRPGVQRVVDFGVVVSAELAPDDQAHVLHQRHVERRRERHRRGEGGRALAAVLRGQARHVLHAVDRVRPPVVRGHADAVDRLGLARGELIRDLVDLNALL